MENRTPKPHDSNTPPLHHPATPPPHAVEVVAGLIFRDGTLLITRRPEGSHLAGCWEFPGGKREPGETPSQALVRELHEELGVGVEVGDLIEDISHSYPGKTVRIEFYRCRLVSGEPQPLGCAALRWVKAPELDTLPFPAADAQLLHRLKIDAHLWR
jgi:mutator protein MutT